MRKLHSSKEFARMAQISHREIKRYREAGLLDPDGDGVLDEYDALRLRFIEMSRARGLDIEEIAGLVESGSEEYPSLDLLYPKDGKGLSLEDAAERVGLTAAQVADLRTAIGLPGGMVLDADLPALEGVRKLLDLGLPWDAILEASRVLGDALRRFAETEMRLTHEYLHEPMEASGMSNRELAAQSEEIVQNFLPLIDPMLVFLHRQHLVRAAVADAVLHLEAGGKPTGGLQVAVLFMDLTSFTAMADIHGDEAAAKVLDRLDVLVRILAQEHHGTLAKQIGDAFMLVFDDPENALGFATAIETAASGEERFPAMRIGIHAGPVLYRVGDYVGSTVNIASRVASAAMPNEILITSPVAGFSDRAGVVTEQVGVRMIRGISEPLTLYRVVRDREPGSRDPVCGMVVGEDAAGRLVREGREYVFCSERCLKTFLESPERYMGAAAEVTGEQA